MKKLKNLSENSLCLILSFLLPFMVLICLFIIRELAPFGDGTLCSMDGFSQYYPMLMNMGESLKEGELFYSFSGALGFNLWAQSGYYTNSPLWLIVYMLPDALKLTGINLLVLLKLCLASVFFCLRLQRVYPERSSNSRVFPCISTAWALSAYMISFINQFMWTDVVMLLPLVILGIDMLVKKKSRSLYILTLALSIWCCFYLSFMVCIFAVLYFAYALLKEKRETKELISTAANFGVSSLIAGGLCAVSVIPVAYALSLTAASEIGFTPPVEIRYTLTEFMSQLLPFRKISLEYGAPNLYCSVTAVIAMIVGFFTKGQSKRDRLLSFLLVTFISLTMCINLGEYIWHGLHYPNQLPARQSFLLIFLILSFAARTLTSEKLKNAVSVTASTLIIVGVVTSAGYQFLTQTWVSNTQRLRGNDELMESFTSMDDSEAFVRLDWANAKKNNYPQQYHYNGVGYYSSTMSGDAWNFFQELGMERYAKNVSTYYTDSYILSRLFGVKYVLEKEGDSIRTNEDALSIAYLSSEDVLSFNASDHARGYAAQRALLSSIALDDYESDKRAIAHLKENELKISYFDTDVIKGTISCEKDGVLLTTLPYDGGWKIYVDGERVDTVKAANYLTACEISRGAHEIELRYTVPGIWLGAVLSFASIIGFGALMWFERKKKNEEADTSCE